MFNLIEKSFLLGLGALAVTKSNVEKFVNDAISQDKMTQGEGNAFLKTFEEEGVKAKANLENAVIEVIKTKGQSLFPNYKSIKELQDKVAELEAKVAALEGTPKN